jgi:transcriptional regulator
MHQNPAFRNVEEEEIRAFVQARGFGVVTAAAADGPIASHVPFVFSHDQTAIDCHILRSNPFARLLRDGHQNALLIVSGPDGYISPDWYDLGPDQVPTWNYIAAHIRGRLRLRPESTLRAHLEQLSAEFENRLVPKRPWTLSKTSRGYVEKMARQIVPVRLEIMKIDGTKKLNQNKSGDAPLNAAEAVNAHGFGHEIQALAEAMRIEQNKRLS